MQTTNQRGFFFVLKSYRASVVPVQRNKVKHSEVRIYGCQLGSDPKVTNHPLLQNPLPVAICKGKPTKQMTQLVNRINLVATDNFEVVEKIVKEELKNGRRN